MASSTLQQVFDAARGYLNDTQVPGGETCTNTMLQVHFNEPYRRMFRCLQGLSKRIQRFAYVTLPANTTVLVPSAYGMTDFSEPEILEERPAQSSLVIVSASNSTPIICTSTAHGLAVGSVVEGTVSGNTSFATWGRWFATVIDANTYSLNGSVAGGAVGTGGTFTPWSQQQFVLMQPLDSPSQGLDGIPQTYLQNYVWANEQLQFRGCANAQQLRITYWASGAPPVIAASQINIDDAIDVLACATAANAARALGWDSLAESLKFTAYGREQEANGLGGLLGEFVKIQVSTMQRGPLRRQLPFRGRKARYGTAILS